MKLKGSELKQLLEVFGALGYDGDLTEAMTAALLEMYSGGDLEAYKTIKALKILNVSDEVIEKELDARTADHAQGVLDNLID